MSTSHQRGEEFETYRTDMESLVCLEFKKFNDIVCALRRLKITRARFLELSRLSNVSHASPLLHIGNPEYPELLLRRSISGDLQAFNEKSIEFQEKMIYRGGLGDETYLPEGIRRA